MPAIVEQSFCNPIIMEKGVKHVPSTALPTSYTPATEQRPIGTGLLSGRRDRNDLHGDIWTMEISCGSTLAKRHRPVVELVAEKLQHKAEADPAGPTCPGWLSVLAGSPGVDPAFHVLLAHLMRNRSPASCRLLANTFASDAFLRRSTLGNFSPIEVLAGRDEFPWE